MPIDSTRQRRQHLLNGGLLEVGKWRAKAKGPKVLKTNVQNGYTVYENGGAWKLLAEPTLE